jgi:Exocyst complex component Sec6/PH domain
MLSARRNDIDDEEEDEDTRRDRRRSAARAPERDGGDARGKKGAGRSSFQDRGGDDDDEDAGARPKKARGGRGDSDPEPSGGRGQDGDERSRRASRGPRDDSGSSSGDDGSYPPRGKRASGGTGLTGSSSSASAAAPAKRGSLDPTQAPQAAGKRPDAVVALATGISDSEASDDDRRPKPRKAAEPHLGGARGAGGAGLGARRADPGSDDSGSDSDGGRGARLERRDRMGDRRSSFAPSAPSMSGWVKKEASTKFGNWQKRFLRLERSMLYFCDTDEQPSAASKSKGSISYSTAIKVETITSIAMLSSKMGKNGPALTAQDRKVFICTISGRTDIVLRADDEATAKAWVNQISAAIKHAKLNERKRANSQTGEGESKRSKPKRRPNNSDESDGDDSDADSDSGPAAPPPPKWFRVFLKPDEAKWMETTQLYLNSLFESIYESGDGKQEAGDAVMGDGGQGAKRISISKLAEATARACGDLEDRAMECRLRGRADVVKHYITMFDLKFLQELDPLTTGNGPSQLGTKQLLQVIDCIEGFVSVRRRALGAMTLTTQEKRPGQILRETRRDMINKYMDVIGPKLHAVSSKVLAKLFSGRGELVRRMMGTRVGTSSPTDLFNLMSEHLKIAREGGSFTLQRRLLSCVMGEVAFYSREVLTDLMDWWARDPSGVDMDYVTAVINDSGVMLDHLEQLESYFAEALKRDADTTTYNAKNASKTRSAGEEEEVQEEDEFDKAEAAQAKEDLAAIEQDFPRAKSELLSAGAQLTGVLVDIVSADFREPFGRLFTPDWEKSNLITVITVTATDYFQESRALLDSFFFDRLTGMVLTHVVEAYLGRLLNADALKKDRKSGFVGGFSSRFKLNEDRLKKLVADVVEVGNCFGQFMPREELTQIMQSINTARELLTIDTDNMHIVFELAMKTTPVVSTHIFLAFERIIALREDLDKKAKKLVLEDAMKCLLEYGQPPEEEDDLLATVGMLGAGGIMHGAAMSQGSSWNPANVTSAIYRAMFPQALERSRTLFANWTPPVRAASPPPAPVSGPSAGNFGLSGSMREAADAQSLDISSFLGNGGDTPEAAGGSMRAGGGHQRAVSLGNASGRAPLVASALASTSTKSSSMDDVPAPKPASIFDTPSRVGGGERAKNRRRAAADDDDEEDEPLPSARDKVASTALGDRGGSAFGTRPSTFAAPAQARPEPDRRSRRRRGGDDDDDE